MAEGIVARAVESGRIHGLESLYKGRYDPSKIDEVFEKLRKGLR